jgi:hypothetical protein
MEIHPTENGIWCPQPTGRVQCSDLYDFVEKIESRSDDRNSLATSASVRE